MAAGLTGGRTDGAYMGRMARFGAWLGKNIDGFVALLLAVGVGVVGLLDDSIDKALRDQVIESGTLLVLALLTTAILRDRWRQEPAEKAMRESFARTVTLPERLERLEGVVSGAGRALQDLSIVNVLNGPEEIARAHAEARADTDRWIFKGGTGTYLRAVTLPECVAAARRERRALLMRLEIIDPGDERVCEAYARFRRSMSQEPDGTGEVWTPERTRKEAFGTILAGCWHHQRFGLLELHIGLSATMTTFRWDLSSSSLIITGEDPRRALITRRGSFYYDSCTTELMASLEQARRVPVELARSVPLSEEPTIEEVRRLFETLGLPLPRSYTDRDIADLTRKALRAKNPYL
ncbi:hypothetical protein OHA77_06565 [Streptosporangium sp. NBC_01639]|uniref:hypothetical protein n=1 Tax=Streptosporangium sp. NBC_01639 TaxID=2975948 RepID=UPI003870D3B9|nr:hypothetical protein OHA77_06565 [Streptosporangium sp. NBC_01639]